MKTLVFFTVLVATIALAGGTVSVGPEPPSEYNAHWRLMANPGVICVRDGLYVYGCNDAAGLIYMGQPINLGGYDGVSISISFSYSLETADDGDYLVVYLADEGAWNWFCEFRGNTDGLTDYTTTLDDYYGCRDLGISILWVSDETGVAGGICLNGISIAGINWGEGEYTNLFTWDATNDVTDHQSVYLPWELSEGVMNCLSFKYVTDLDTQGWWAVDNVEVTADGESVLPLQGGGYGVEGFESGGWHQDQHGMNGEWETGTDHATGDMSGDNWQCDSAARPWRYEAETFSPFVTVGRARTVGVDFDTWFHPVGAGESAS
ncbi:MAG: hypothetical protein NTW26_02725, partial [bacterium]|nr:hypothetical protein [bacterium]